MEGKWKVQGYLEPGMWIVECGMYCGRCISKEGGRADTSDAQLSQTSSLTIIVPARIVSHSNVQIRYRNLQTHIKYPRPHLSICQ